MSLSQEMQNILNRWADDPNLRHRTGLESQEMLARERLDYEKWAQMLMDKRQREMQQVAIQAQIDAERRRRGGTGLGGLLGTIGGTLLGSIPGVGPLAKLLLQAGGGGLGSIAEGHIAGTSAGQGIFNNRELLAGILRDLGGEMGIGKTKDAQKKPTSPIGTGLIQPGR